MQILFVTGREPSYPRNDVLERAFKRISTVTLTTDARPGGVVMRSLRACLHTVPRLVTRHYDLVCVGFYGHLLMVLLRGFTRRPILFDAFLSTYDTLAFDRNTVHPRSLGGKLAWQLDRTTCLWAAHVLLDTQLHVDYFADTFRLPASRFTSLPVGCNEDLFAPRPTPPAGPLTVLFYSTLLPLHGAEVVLEAAALLRSQGGIRFRFIGHGPRLDHFRRLAHTLNLDHLDFLPPVALRDLPEQIASAHICLGGHFGQSAKAGRTVPGKLYQMLAMARPVIAADTPANRDLLTHGTNAYLCPPGDPAALAAAILDLAKHPASREALGASGRKLYEVHGSEAVITDKLRAVVRSLVG